jgi:hypothetical protein
LLGPAEPGAEPVVAPPVGVGAGGLSFPQPSKQTISNAIKEAIKINFFIYKRLNFFTLLLLENVVNLLKVALGIG